MRWLRRKRADVQKADLDDLSLRLTETVKLTEQRLVATLRPRPSGSRLAAVMAAAVAVASGLGGYAVYALGQSGTPTADDPGRIGVAVLDDAGSATPLQVVARFFVDSSTVQLAITDFTGRADPQRPPRVVIYLCGAIRQEARVSDPNRGDLSLQPLPDSPIEMDSRLGYRRECSYAIDEFTDGFQALVTVSTNQLTPVTSGANIVYRFPGITTLIIDEELEGSIVHPLDRDSTIDVAVSHVPVDLTVTASRPQIPSSGQLAWSYPLADPNLPDTYRVAGSLGDAQQAAQARVFIAGALVGVCGAAVLWFLEALVQVIKQRSEPRP